MHDYSLTCTCITCTYIYYTCTLLLLVYTDVCHWHVGGHYLKYKSMCACMYMEIDLLSALAYENKNDKKGNPHNHSPDKQKYTARDIWMPGLGRWVKDLLWHVHAHLCIALPWRSCLVEL